MPDIFFRSPRPAHIWAIPSPVPPPNPIPQTWRGQIPLSIREYAALLDQTSWDARGVQLTPYIVDYYEPI